MPRQTFPEPQGWRHRATILPVRGDAIETDLIFFLIGIPAVIIAGVSKGGFGSGASFAATPLMALIMPPEQALGLLLPLLLLIDASTLKPYWRQWDGRQAKLLLLGSVPGLVLGTLFWRLSDPDTLRLLIGAIALGYVAHSVLRHFSPSLGTFRRMPAVVGVLAGCGAAFTSFVSHAGGPVLAVYLLSLGLTKTAYQATSVLVFGVVNVGKVVGYGALGAITAESLLQGLSLAPAALLGAWLGVVAHRSIPERAFFLVTYALLLVAGTKLIFDAFA